MSLPSCRLFLTVPDKADSEAAAACFRAAVETGDVAALRLRQRLTEEETARMFSALMPIAHGHDVAVILAGDPELAGRYRISGVEVGGLDRYKLARALLGTTAFVGAACGASRHAAMELAEAGADYVGFSDPQADVADIIAWWAELFEVPCVALDPADAAQAGELARRGADFVRPDDAMWTSPDSARRIVGDTLRSIAEARA